jgi:hypothetical protein
MEGFSWLEAKSRYVIENCHINQRHRMSNLYLSANNLKESRKKEPFLKSNNRLPLLRLFESTLGIAVALLACLLNVINGIYILSFSKV